MTPWTGDQPVARQRSHTCVMMSTVIHFIAENSKVVSVKRFATRWSCRHVLHHARSTQYVEVEVLGNVHVLLTPGISWEVSGQRHAQAALPMPIGQDVCLDVTTKNSCSCQESILCHNDYKSFFTFLKIAVCICGYRLCRVLTMGWSIKDRWGSELNPSSKIKH